MKIYNCHRHYSDEELKELEAEFINEVSEIVNETSIGYDEEGNVLFFFIKDCFTEDYLKPIEPIIDSASTFIISNGRAQASGVIDKSLPLWQKCMKQIDEVEDKHIKNKYTINPTGIGNYKYKMCNPVYSNIGGYFEKPLVGLKNKVKDIPKCRLTQFSSRNFVRWRQVIPYFERISVILSENLPNHYRKQNDFVAKHRERIGNSCYSTITINKNFRTAIHIDKGDFKNGIGTLTTMGNYTGGEFCLVDYDIGINLRPTDILFVNVHKHHANLPFEGTRYSMVSYVRENITKCGLKYDYKVVIPSYKRSAKLGQKTLNMLKDIDPKRIHIFIVEEEQVEYNIFKELGYNIIVGLKGISKQREFIANYFDKDTPLVWCDDDCDKIIGMDKKEVEDYEQFFIERFSELEKSNLNVLGVYPVSNTYYMKDRICDGLKFIIGAFRMTFNQPQYEKTNYTLVEDYARTLNYYKGDGGVLRNERFYIKHNLESMEGGIGAEENRSQVEKSKQVSKLVSENTKYLSIKKRKNGNEEVKMKNLKRFNPKQEIIAGFWEGTLTQKELTCIQSFVKRGYKFHLYSYTDHKVPNTEWINAEEIVCFAQIKDFPTICAFSDYFRYKLIFQREVVWTDLDMLMINDLPQTKFIISSEHMKVNGAFKSKKYYKANIGILKFPLGNAMIGSLIDYIEKNMDKIIKNTSCMDIFEKWVEIFNYYEYVSTPLDFCPVSWAYYKELYNGTYDSCPLKYGIEKPSLEYIKTNSICLHLWNNKSQDKKCPNIDSFFKLFLN